MINEFQLFRNIKLSLYGKLFDQNCSEVTLDALFNDIKYGHGNGFSVGLLRELKRLGNDEAARNHKINMPAVTISAFAAGSRKIENIITYNSIIVLDIDHLPAENLQKVKKIIASDPCTLSVNISPSGDGLKVLVYVNSGIDHHKTAFYQVARHYEKLTGCDVDMSGSDPLRLCIISHDPELYVNPNSAIFSVDISKKVNSNISHLDTPFPINPERQIKLLEFILDDTFKIAEYYKGNRNNYIFLLACNMNRGAVPISVSLPFAINRFKDLSSQEITSSFNSAYNNTNEHGTRDYEVELLKYEKDQGANLNTTIFLESVYNQLPSFFKEPCSFFKDVRERDIALMSILGIASGCLNDMYSIYRGRKIYPNIFIYIVAPPGSNKGSMEYARMAVYKHHKKLIEQSKKDYQDYQLQIEQYYKNIKNGIAEVEKPQPPKLKKFFIPGNSSAAAMLKQLYENDDRGVICESEGDTIGVMLKQDWGNFSDIFRKAFHHEPISISRKDPADNIEIESPRLSIIITSTPDQVTGIISSPENGLFSRFLYYLFPGNQEWIDMDVNAEEESLSEYFETYGTTIENFIKYYENKQIRMVHSPSQKNAINEFGRSKLKEIAAFVGPEAAATVKRLALLIVRISTILAAARNFDNNIPPQDELNCSDQDFSTALTLIEILLEHSMTMFQMLPKKGALESNSRLKMFFELLPDKFTRKEGIQTGARLNLKDSTLDKYLAKLIQHKYLVTMDYGVYQKANHTNLTNYTK